MKNEIDEFFTTLDKWRLLPDYQLERRTDIFFALYLPQILEDKLNNNKPTIIPEFPIIKGIVDPTNQTNQSIKIDYLVITDDRVFLVELKTDNNSWNENQYRNLKNTREANIPKTIEGLIQISKATKSKIKYNRLLKEFEDIDWLKQNEDESWENISPKREIEIIYIQPSKNENLPHYVFEDIKDRITTIIYFDKIAEILEKNPTVLSTRFAKSLREWKNNPNI